MSRQRPKLSRLFPRIPKEISHTLPWQALLELFDVATITGLEVALNLKDGTLSKASRGFYGSAGDKLTRGLSANVHQTLLEGMTKNFSIGNQMRAWMNKHWPVELFVGIEELLEALYESVDLAHQIPQVGTFPTDYIERDEKDEILSLLLTSKRAQILWLTGPGGSGKSTLALSLVRCDWDRLKNHYEKIFWVIVEQANYADGLRQIAESLDLAGQSVGVIEQKLRNLTRRSKVLFILDDVQELSGLWEWQQLAGSLGKLLATSRTRLAENELRANGRLHQIQLGGFSLEQSRQFFEDSSPAMEILVEQTGGLPLALRILSGLKLELGYSADEIQARLKQFSLEALEYPANQIARDTSLRFCFDISYQALAKSHPQAAHYFDCAGVFQTRTILKTLLDDVAEVDNPLAGDKLTAILLRYNLAEVLKIKGERFIQLHPLLHEFAREKLTSLSQDDALNQRYARVIYDGVYRNYYELANGIHRTSHQIHAQDILHVLEIWICEDSWLWIIHMIIPVIELYLADNPLKGKAYEVISQIEARLPESDTPEIMLLKIILLNWTATLEFADPDLERQKARLELARGLGKKFEPIETLEDVYWNERGNTLCRLVELLRADGQVDQASELMNSDEAAQIFAHDDSHSRAFRQAESFRREKEYGKALDILQSIETSTGAAFKYRVDKLFNLEHQAECYEKLEQYEQAIQLYETLFAETETQAPPAFQVDYGQSLVRCLKEKKRFAQMEHVLDVIDEILSAQNERTFKISQLESWEDRIESRQALGDRDGVLAYARKAVCLAEQLEYTASQERLQALVNKLETG